MNEKNEINVLKEETVMKMKMIDLLDEIKMKKLKLKKYRKNKDIEIIELQKLIERKIRRS